MTRNRFRHSGLVFSLAAFGAALLGLGACSSDVEPAPVIGAAGKASGGSPSGGSAGAVSAVAGAANGGATTAIGGASSVSGAAGLGGSGGLAGASGALGIAGAAGSGGVAGSAGTGGVAGYNPCPTNGDACRVMPLGDSITDGCCGQNTASMGASYRLELFRLSLTHSKKLTFVGSHTSGPNTVDNVTFPKKQEGHSGWTIADGGGRPGLQEQVVGWLNSNPPDIVTLMIGTNDIDIQYKTSEAPARLGVLLDTISQVAPKALIVLAQMVPTRKDDENVRVRSYNEAMPALVKTRADAGKHVILVDMYGAYTKNADFKNALLANDLHPSDAGYAVMANTWFDAIANLLPAK